VVNITMIWCMVTR